MKEEQTMKGLPKDWKRVKVNDVCINIIGGGTPSTQKPEYWQGDIPWISSADIYGIKDLKPRRKITLEAVKNSATNVLPKGGIVVVTRVGLGKLTVAPYDLCFSQDSQGLILKKDLISTEYALLVLHQEVQNFKHQSRGTTINGVTKKQLAGLEITLPPLETQQQIVSKIEELFSELDKGIEELKTAQQQLKFYRQAVLKWAFEGKLTNEDVKDGELPEGWAWKKVDELKDNIPNAIGAGPFGTIFKAKDFRDSGIPIIFLRHVKPGNYNTRKPGFMDRKVWEELFQSYSVFGGELLITKLGEPPGDCAIYPKGIGPAMVTPDVIKLSVNESLVNSKYLMYYFNSELSRKALEDIAFGTTRLRITLPIFKKLPIPYCSKEEQQQIVQEIESRLSVCDKIEETITDSLKQAEVLRQSILKKAFEGKIN